MRLVVDALELFVEQLRARSLFVEKLQAAGEADLHLSVWQLRREEDCRIGKVVL